MNNTEYFYPRNRAEWRKWLEINHKEVDNVWLIFFKKNSGVASITYDEAVEEALCFGWIDSKVQRIDGLSRKQFFCKRRKNSFWSEVNKKRVKILIEKGLMHDAGYGVIEQAKQNGYWNLFDDAEKLILPDELISNLKANPTAKLFFENLSDSTKKSLLRWLLSAKMPTTKSKRINEIIDNANQNKLPKQYEMINNNKSIEN